MSETAYGPKLNPRELKLFIKNLMFNQQHDVPPVCIWGSHGIGKSELVREIANEWNWPIVYFSPAQSEEMGDLIGLPFIRSEKKGSKQSHFAAPNWVPKQKGPGILLIDDFNRADDRILRGIMPLLLQKAMLSWQLPENWVIVLTANPDGGDYSVTPIDDAILTRMVHANMVFDPKAWAFWAEKQQIPGDGIGFVLSHPELINNRRTTPRTLTWFFQLWKKAGLPPASEEYLKQLANSCLDPMVAAAFVEYLQSNQINLPDPIDILRGSVDSRLLLKSLNTNGVIRNDRIHLLYTRLLNHLNINSSQLDSKSLENLLSFLLSEDMPVEQILLFMRSLGESKHPSLMELLKNASLAEICTG